MVADLLGSAGVRTWTTVFVSIVVQATPFLVFGVLLSAVIATCVPPSFFASALPRRPALAVPVAAASGAVLPGCECGSVPVAGALVRRGVPTSAALAFLLAAPAINPVVLVATAVAFPDDPRMVVARAGASVVVAVLMGWLWLRLGRADWIKLPDRSAVDGQPRWRAFWASCRHDMAHAGGFLVVGGIAAATLNVVVPGRWMQALAESPWLSVLALAGLAVLLSICSEADAFVAASLTAFSPTAKLAFLVVGPMIDVKLFAMQSGAFGSRFAVRFGPATFAVALAVSAAVGWVVW
ncbi:permease [Actinokineospora soli]|uniref:Permease n=1 Tax=Actinokineospora soli TaxID=1048753 RepID=A0ABW2THV3_9PSEU